MCEYRWWGLGVQAAGATSPLKVTGLSAGKHYSCKVRATNAVGTGSYSNSGASVLVPIHGARCTPAVTGETPSAGAVSVTFSAPASDGGSPITSYTAFLFEYRWWGLGVQERAGSPLKATGLSAGKHYSCKVRATNAVGTGSDRRLRTHRARHPSNPDRPWPIPHR